MKKALVFAIIAVMALATGFFAYRYANPETSRSGAAPRVAITRSVPSSSEAADSSPSEDTLEPGSSSPALKNSARQQTDPERIMAAIDLDWKKFTLKPSPSKVFKDKSYSVYDIWNEDYVVGPKILVDQSSRNVFTWAPGDASPIPAAKDMAFDKTLRTITGILKDGAMMSIVLTTDSGNTLTVRRLGVDTSRLTSLKAGDRIKVTYTGVISGSDTTRAFIARLENVS